MDRCGTSSQQQGETQSICNGSNVPLHNTKIVTPPCSCLWLISDQLLMTTVGGGGCGSVLRRCGVHLASVGDTDSLCLLCGWMEYNLFLPDKHVSPSSWHRARLWSPWNNIFMDRVSASCYPTVFRGCDSCLNWNKDCLWDLEMHWQKAVWLLKK